VTRSEGRDLAHRLFAYWCAQTDARNRAAWACLARPWYSDLAEASAREHHANVLEASLLHREVLARWVDVRG
jgi:hypothetical protein